MSLTGANGREVVLYRVGPGEICLQTFACLVENRVYRAEGVAETNLSGHMLSQSAFFEQLSTDAAFRDKVLTAIANRFSEYEELVESVALTGFDTRLARVLLRLADDKGEVVATHEELAAETASARAFVSRRLGALAELGVVSLQRGKVRLADIDALRRIAAQDW